MKDQIRFFWKVSFFLGGWGVKGDKDSMPQEIEVQQERQKKEKRPLATNLPAQEQQAKKVPPKPKKKRFTLHTLAKRLMYYLVELPFQEDKTNRNRESPRIPTKHRKVQPIKLALRQSRLNPT